MHVLAWPAPIESTGAHGRGMAQRRKPEAPRLCKHSTHLCPPTQVVVPLLLGRMRRGWEVVWRTGEHSPPDHSVTPKIDI